MIEFMFGVLGSVVFWIVYIMLCLVVTTLYLRNKVPSSLNYIEGKCPKKDQYGSCDACEEYHSHHDVSRLCSNTHALLILLFLFWPIVGVYYIIKFIFVGLIKIYMGIIKTIDKNIPEIKITKEEK